MFTPNNAERSKNSNFDVNGNLFFLIKKKSQTPLTTEVAKDDTKISSDTYIPFVLFTRLSP